MVTNAMVSAPACHRQQQQRTRDTRSRAQQQARTMAGSARTLAPCCTTSALMLLPDSSDVGLAGHACSDHTVLTRTHMHTPDKVHHGEAVVEDELLIKCQRVLHAHQQASGSPLAHSHLTHLQPDGTGRAR
jgi:hypothetical protein